MDSRDAHVSSSKNDTNGSMASKETSTPTRKKYNNTPHSLKMPAAFKALYGSEPEGQVGSNDKEKNSNSNNGGTKDREVITTAPKLKTCKSSPTLDRSPTLRSNGSMTFGGGAGKRDFSTPPTVDRDSAHSNTQSSMTRTNDQDDDGDWNAEDNGEDEYYDAESDISDDNYGTITQDEQAKDQSVGMSRNGEEEESAEAIQRLSIQESRRSASRVRSSMDLKNNRRSSSRDRYGFKKKTNFITEQEYDQWWDSYEPYLRRRKKKWVALMKESGLYNYTPEDGGDNSAPVRFPPKSEKLKRYIRKGIPAEWRGNAWFWFAKGPEQLAAHPGLYDKLCKQTQSLKNNDTELIERDLQRTFPDNIYFRDGHGSSREAEETALVQALRRVLTCFSVYMPKIGYCQSLNFLAGMLLLFMDEEKAFWMLVIITQRYLPGVHEVSLEGVSIDQGVLVLCIKEALPSLWEVLGKNFEGRYESNLLSNLPPITLCTTPWFMSGYIGVLPTESVLRVWDSFFFEESKVFFRIALTILKMSEPKIAGISDQMEVFQVIQNLPKKQIDASALMETCFKRRNGFGHISQQEIIRLRKFVHERRQKYTMRMAAETMETRSVYNTSTTTATTTSGAGNMRSFSRGKKKNKHESETDEGNETVSTDLDEIKKLKPGIGKRGLHLSRRMKSLRRHNGTAS